MKEWEWENSPTMDSGNKWHEIRFCLASHHAQSHPRNHCRWPLSRGLWCLRPSGSSLESICYNSVRPRNLDGMSGNNPRPDHITQFFHVFLVPGFTVSLGSTLFCHLQSLWTKPSKGEMWHCLMDGTWTELSFYSSHLPHLGVEKGEPDGEAYPRSQRMSVQDSCTCLLSVSTLWRPVGLGGDTIALNQCFQERMHSSKSPCDTFRLGLVSY